MFLKHYVGLEEDMVLSIIELIDTVETEGLLEMLPHEEQLYLRYQYGDQTLTKPFDEFLQERDLTPRKFTRQANLIVKKLRDLVKKEGVSINAT